MRRIRLVYFTSSMGIESDMNSRWVMFHDPAGNRFELVQFKPG